MRKKKCPLNIKLENFGEESFLQVQSTYDWQRETNGGLIKQTESKKIAERPLNITSILNNIKSLTTQVY